MSICRTTTVLLCVLLASSVIAQSPAPGHRLFGPLAGTDTHLVDVQGNIVHTWPSSFSPGAVAYMLEDGTLLRTIKTMTSGYPAGVGGGVQRVALDGTILWDYRYDSNGRVAHHDVEALPNGNVLILAWETFTATQAIAMGRDPATIPGNVFRPEHIVEVQPTGPTTGTIVWEWRLVDHVIQDFDPAQSNFGVVGNHPELVDINYPPLLQADDWIHANGIDYDPINDLIAISANRLHEVWIIDHSTTTAEAAGHTGGWRGRGGDILYRWGNPLAYRAGTAADQQLFAQHDPTFIPPGYPGAGNLLLFNNLDPAGSSVFEIDLPQDFFGSFIFGPGGVWGPAAPLWSHSGGFQSSFISGAERLPNGNTLICSGAEARVFEVDPAGTEVWTHTLGPAGTLVFQAHYYERTLWSDTETLSVSAGGTVNFDLIAGSQAGSDIYLLLGSTSGAAGVQLGQLTLPLTVDDYFIFSLLNYNSPHLVNTLGFLDQVGAAQASFTVGAGLIPAQFVGLELRHAFLSGGANVTHVSNAVTFTLVP